jgi:hypothetical protein
MTGETVDATDHLTQSDNILVGRTPVESTDPNSLEVFREAFKGLPLNSEESKAPN